VEEESEKETSFRRSLQQKAERLGSHNPSSQLIAVCHIREWLRVPQELIPYRDDITVSYHGMIP